MCSQVLFLFVLKKGQRLLDNQRLQNKKKEKTDPKLLWTSSNRYYPKLLKEF